MTKYVFKPEVTEDEWLGLSSCDVWSMWRSMPRPKGAKEWDHTRKERLIGADLMRLVADQLTDPRLSCVIEIGEQYADRLIPARKYWVAQEAAYEARDELRFRSAAARDAALVAEKYLYSLDDFLMYLSGAVETRAELLARRAGKGTRGLARKSHKLVESRIRDLIREVHGNPFRTVKFNKKWRTDTAIALAKQMYESREFSAMPILADALQDAGCDNENILNHCRDTNQVHVRGCWVVDLVLGKQ
ncbi:MAG: hypothetical protein L0241_32200 [Planctomycetia bacterium]|nr:hypothetical protein [Planctomycetia bacterium]